MSLALTVSFLWRHPLLQRHGSLRQQTAALRRYLLWQVASRLLPGPIAVPWVKGSWLMLSRGLTGVTGNWYVGLHEWPDMAFVLHLLRPQDTFADIGANVGSYTVLASAAVGASTIAFEPVPQTFQWLCRHVALNVITNRVIAHQTAVGRAEGELRFSIDRGAMNSVVRTDYLGLAQVVPVLSIDAEPGFAGACCWKLDVEGHELDVLAGAKQTLAKAAPQAILCEDRREEVQQILREAGFQSCCYDPFSRTLSAEVASPGSNELWVRDFSWVQHRLRTAPVFQILGMSL
ncbi:MAG: FkbM family methyltransferase [Cyanobium sp.]